MRFLVGGFKRNFYGPSVPKNVLNENIFGQKNPNSIGFFFIYQRNFAELIDFGINICIIFRLNQKQLTKKIINVFQEPKRFSKV